MGKRGPKPTSKAVLSARGSWRANARGDEVKPLVPLTLIPPEICHKDAHRVYEKLAIQLKSMGLFTQSDELALALFCNGLIQYKALQDEMDASGLIVWTKKGKRLNPALQAMRTLYMQLCVGFKQFGLSPVDRAGLVATVTEIQSNVETKASLFKLA